MVVKGRKEKEGKPLHFPVRSPIPIRKSAKAVQAGMQMQVRKTRCEA